MSKVGFQYLRSLKFSPYDKQHLLLFLLWVNCQIDFKGKRNIWEEMVLKAFMFCFDVSNKLYYAGGETTKVHS